MPDTRRGSPCSMSWCACISRLPCAPSLRTVTHSLSVSSWWVKDLILWRHAFPLASRCVSWRLVCGIGLRCTLQAYPSSCSRFQRLVNSSLPWKALAIGCTVSVSSWHCSASLPAWELLCSSCAHFRPQATFSCSCLWWPLCFVQCSRTA